MGYDIVKINNIIDTNNGNRLNKANCIPPIDVNTAKTSIIINNANFSVPLNVFATLSKKARYEGILFKTP